MPFVSKVVSNAQAPVPHARSFPPGFHWGCAAAAYQIEGSANEEGRGPSVWDTFSHTPGKTFHGETGDAADDSGGRYGKRFGTHYVDFNTLKRTPKLSAEWYRATIAANSVA